MRSSPKPAILVLHGDPTDPVMKQASALLDQSGLSYVTQATPGKKARTPNRGVRSVRLTSGVDSVSNFSRRELVEFLWAHGAKFEDS